MISKKVVILSGTSRGIGKYLAEYYLRKDYIIAGCSRGGPSLKHNNYIHFQLDVCEEDRVSKMIKKILKRFNKIDILINNAGTASMNYMVLTPTPTALEIIKTNFLGTFNFTREVSKIMIKQKRGRIINISTVAVPLALEGESVYIASKAAIEGFTKSIAKELSPFNITVNTVGIAPIMTDLLKAIPKAKFDSLLNKMTIKRFTKFKDISNVIDFFLKKESDYITAQIIYLGGVC